MSNTYLARSIKWYIGYDKDYKVKAIPYIYNKDCTKIKNLTNANIYDVTGDFSIMKLFSEKYNLQQLAFLDILSFQNYRFALLKQDEVVDEHKIENVCKILSKIYQSKFKKTLKQQQKEQELKKVEDVSKDF